MLIPNFQQIFQGYQKFSYESEVFASDPQTINFLFMENFLEKRPKNEFYPKFENLLIFLWRFFNLKSFFGVRGSTLHLEGASSEPSPMTPPYQISIYATDNWQTSRWMLEDLPANTW